MFGSEFKVEGFEIVIDFVILFVFVVAASLSKNRVLIKKK